MQGTQKLADIGEEGSSDESPQVKTKSGTVSHPEAPAAPAFSLQRDVQGSFTALATARGNK